jgi:NhaP-type Na+/H+ or K+/H+ antiporter
MSWLSKQLEPTPAHFTYLILATFLIFYALFANLIRNRLHLSEPPLATLVGIMFGPKGIGLLDPTTWGLADNITQEATRIIVGVQVFAVGVELPKAYFARHWKSVAMLLGPVMTFSWLMTALFVYLLVKTDFSTALVISACLAPTDPVLAASTLADSHFANRVPRRLRHLLSAESGCNDGVSFPFLYVGLYAILKSTFGSAVKEWVISTILWKCLLGALLGLLIGHCANRALRFSEANKYTNTASLLVFYFLLAIFAIGIGSTLGLDDFLIAFGAGLGFAWDGWFANKTKETHLPDVLDLLLNSSMFVYFGSIIPWSDFNHNPHMPNLNPLRLLILLLLVILFRRIPIVVALKRWIPDIRTYREALFCGHFGPMGLGALFLVIEARAQLESSTSLPLPHPPTQSTHKRAIETIWPVVCFIILGSIMIHGLSVAIISVGGHYSRHEGERAPLLGAETEGLSGMVHEGGGGESEPSVSGDEDPDPVN